MSPDLQAAARPRRFIRLSTSSESPLKNVITLEDPIEYELLAGKSNEAGITQVQINTKIGMTFSAALRAALRQDPDIIMVGEIRDKDTA